MQILNLILHRLAIDLYIIHDSLFDFMTFEIIDYVMFHNLQIPPSPPLLKWGISFA
jgi:hypothetical protein